MMNCIEFRRLALADPHHPPPQALDHIQECAGCRDFIASAARTDTALAARIGRTPLPDGLADRVLLHVHGTQGLRTRPWAIAASVLLVLAAALAFTFAPDDAGLERAALAHVEEEPYNLTAQQNVSLQAVDDALATVGARRHGDIGVVTYLGTCPLPGGEGKHLVVTSPHGRFSLILMPAQIANRKVAEQGSHSAIAKPAARGTYAIVAGTTPHIYQIEKMLDQNISWSRVQ